MNSNDDTQVPAYHRWVKLIDGLEVAMSEDEILDTLYEENLERFKVEESGEQEFIKYLERQHKQAPDNYEQRVVAFIDFIGWRNLIANSLENERVFKHLWVCLKCLEIETNSPYRYEREQAAPDPLYDISQLSDSIAISTRLTDEYQSFFLVFIRKLKKMQQFFLLQGYLCRGSVIDQPHFLIPVESRGLGSYHSPQDIAGIPRIPASGGFGRCQIA